MISFRAAFGAVFFRFCFTIPTKVKSISDVALFSFGERISASSTLSQFCYTDVDEGRRRMYLLCMTVWKVCCLPFHDSFLDTNELIIYLNVCTYPFSLRYMLIHLRAWLVCQWFDWHYMIIIVLRMFIFFVQFVFNCAPPGPHLWPWV